MKALLYLRLPAFAQLVDQHASVFGLPLGNYVHAAKDFEDGYLKRLGVTLLGERAYLSNEPLKARGYNVVGAFGFR